MHQSSRCDNLIGRPAKVPELTHLLRCAGLPGERVDVTILLSRHGLALAKSDFKASFIIRGERQKSRPSWPLPGGVVTSANYCQSPRLAL